MTRICALLGLLMLAACTDVASSDIKTSGMSAAINVSSSGSASSQVSVQLNVDTNITDFVTLSSGDSLSATAGGQAVPLSESNLLGAVKYQGTLSGESAQGVSYVVALQRASDTSAPNSTCTMPAPIGLTAPVGSPSFSRASQSIVVTLAAGSSGDALSYSVSGSCIAGQSNTVTGDSGTFTIGAGSIAPAASGPDAGNPAASTCDVTLTITRTNTGTLDPHFYGGSIQCQQTATTTFVSTP